MSENRRLSLTWPVLVMLGISGPFLPLPWSEVAQGLVMLSCLTVVVRAAKRIKFAAWKFLATGAVLAGIAPVSTEIHNAIAPGPVPFTVGDVFLLAGYGALIVGLLRVLDARTMAVQTRPLFDSLIASLWITWLIIAVIGPDLEAQLSGVELVASTAFLPFSIAMVYLLLQVITGAGERDTSIRLLAILPAAVAVSEVMFLVAASGRPGARRIALAFAMMAILGLTAAVTHPSADRIGIPSTDQINPLSRVRMIYLAGSVLGLALISILPSSTQALLPLKAALILATASNVWLALSERETLMIKERSLRRSSTEMLRISDPAQLVATACVSVEELLSDKAFIDVEMVKHDEHEWLCKPYDEPYQGDELELALLDEALEMGEIIRTEQVSDRPGLGHSTKLIVPLAKVSNHAHLLVLEASPVLTPTEVEQIQQVAEIAERALAAHDLREISHNQRADTRFRSLVQDSSDVVVLLAPATAEVKMVSPSLQRILGQSETEYIHTSIIDKFRPNDRAHLATMLAQTRNGKHTAPRDMMAMHADGQYRWFSVAARDHSNNDEIGGVVMNMTDIHGRKKAELLMSESEQQYRALIHNSRDVFAVLDNDLEISYISPNVDTLLGYTPSNLLASRFTSILTPESTELLMDCLAKRQGDITSDVVELTVKTSTGERRTVQTTMSGWSNPSEMKLSVTMSDVTDQRDLESALRTESYYDKLTGLVNRSAFVHEVQQQLQSMVDGEAVGIVHLDIKDFRSLNESVGYEAGDALLVEVATRLRSSLRPTDSLARLGGNEFAVATTADHVQGPVTLATRIQAMLHEPFLVAGRSHQVEVAIGVDTTTDRRTAAQTMFEEAALALGVSRKSNVTEVTVFTPEMRRSATERFELTSELRDAIANGELSLVYQPITDIHTQLAYGIEALVRWNNPKRGPISPGVFIPLAEKSGAIIELGRWVMETACIQLKTWHQTLPGASQLAMSINVSALQLENAGEAKRLAQLAIQSGVDTKRITVELTESTLIEDDQWIRNQLLVMQKLGMKVAIDDFGTGAAGLSHLRDIPFDVLKIDKSYVDTLTTSEDSVSLVKGVIDLAHNMGAVTVAEGIEESTELETLQGLGCDLGQGFYLGRPMNPQAFEGWLAQLLTHSQ